MISENDLTSRIDQAVKTARLKKEWRQEYMAISIRDMDKIEEGRAEGLIFGSIRIYREEMNLRDEEIKTRLMAKYDISEAEAERYLKLQTVS